MGTNIGTNIGPNTGTLTHARSPTLLQLIKTAADGRSKPLLLLILWMRTQRPLTRSLVLEAIARTSNARPRGLRTKPRRSFARASSTKVRTHRGAKGFAPVKRNKAGLFKTLIDKYLKDQQP